MRLLIISTLVAGFTLLSCKKESQSTSANTDTITTAESTDEIPIPAPVDTLVAAPKSDTASMKTDSSKAIK